MMRWKSLARVSIVCFVVLACSGRETQSQQQGTSSGGATPTTRVAYGGEMQSATDAPTVGGSVVDSTTTVAAGTSNGGAYGASAGAAISGTAGSGVAGCSTVPPLWVDCESVGDFQAPVAAAGATNSAVPPESLTAVSDLSSRVSLVREQTKASVLTQYSNYWKSLRTTNCYPHTVCLSDHGIDPPPGSTPDPPGGTTNDPGQTTDPTTGSDTNATRSGTNVQVAGVDEPDLLKLDARYVYIVTRSDLLILDAQDAATTSVAARLKLEGTPKSLLITGDRALVIASTGNVPQKAACTYAYDCQFSGDGYPTLLLVIDIADRKLPRVVRRIQLSGSYLSGRMIGSNVHIVTSNPVKQPSISWPNPNVTARTATEGLAELNQQYQTAIAGVANAAVDFGLPMTKDEVIERDGSAPTEVAVGSTTIHTASGIPSGVMVVSSLDIASQTGLSQDMVLSNPGALYASQNLLYMAVPEEQSNYPGYGRDATSIHAFTLAAGTATYRGSGRVKGHVLNQFSLDEYQGDLRVATSTGRVPDPTVHSTVSILAWQGDRLTDKGSVDQIAPGEDIRAVRFVGPRGYVVTFKKTDPLFVLDLADGGAPKMLGELKIPGFSTYIHPLDDQHLLSMGYDADDHGSFAFFNGIQLQIMNVADPTNPLLLFKETIGTRGSSSEALTDHLAFNYFAPKKMLAIPMTICEGGGNGKYADVLTFTGLLVYDVTVESGFHLHGRVPHPAPSGYYDASSQPTCSNWWTNASSPVKRSAFIDDYVLSLGDALVKVSPLPNLSNTVASFAVGTVPCDALGEAECGSNPRCTAIGGTRLSSATQEYLGCASIPTGQTALICQAGSYCIASFTSKDCATVASSCAPDGWGTLASGSCTAALCGN
jgi:hypothetical protein